MFQLNIKQLLKNKILWAWPIISVLLAVIAGPTTDFHSAGNSYSFMLGAGANALPSSFILNGMLGFFMLIAIIGIPFHLNENLNPQRASLILSKSISRTEFFFAEFAGVMAVVAMYTLFSIVTLAILLFVEAGIFPYQLYLAMLLYIPVYFFVIYESIVLLLILTNSYLASVLVSYLLIVPLSGFLFNADKFLGLFGWHSDSVLWLTNALSYLIPSSFGFKTLMFSMNQGGGGSLNQMTSGVLSNGFAAFDGSLFGFVLISCIPFFLLSYYLMRRKQF